MSYSTELEKEILKMCYEILPRTPYANNKTLKSILDRVQKELDARDK